MASTIVKKLTAAFGIPAPKVLALVLAHPQKRPYAGRLVGIASGTKTGVSQFGDWTCLVGMFRHISPDGEITSASQAFGPDIVIDPVVAQLVGGAQSVTIAVDVFAVESEKSPVGWTYVVEQAIEETETDPLVLLMNKTTARPLALPAPATMPETTAQPDTQPATRPTAKTSKKG